MELFRLIKEGRIHIRPFYVFADEFLESGEGIIRNLLIGHKICESVAKSAGIEKINSLCLKAGYVPDTFGHTWQLPQILQGFDIPTMHYLRGYPPRFGNHEEYKGFNADTVLNKLPKRTTDTIYTSRLFRSMGTAGELFEDSVIYLSSSLFNEFELSIIRLPLLLPFKAWTSVSRTTWLLGRKGKNTESYHDAKQRVKKCVLFLEEKAGENKQVILVSHGFLNRSIKNQLVKKGWKVTYDQGLKNLGATILRK